MVTANKSIIVIGGGISGLSVLHFLRKKYLNHPEISIKLLEKSTTLGGTIKTIHDSNTMFECGPNGFLDSRALTLRLVKELGLESSLLYANPSSNTRYLSLKNKLHPLPTGLLSFLQFKPLSLWDKFRIPFEIFVGPSHNPEESVYDFGARRLGENFSKVFLDPLVSGIYAGNAKKLHLKSTFPKIYELEQKYESLFKGAIHQWRSRKKISETNSPVKNVSRLSGGHLLSFKKGMSQLIERLTELNKDSILLEQEVQLIVRSGQQFVLHSNQRVHYADEIFLCVPAYQAVSMVKPVSESLSMQLSKIYYAPIAVVGLVFKKDQLLKVPKGFGYLVPTWEHRTVLGVVFDSQIYPNRADSNHTLFRIMLGGACFPEVVRKTETELFQLAEQELRSALLIKQNHVPVQSFIVVWSSGIPQYTVETIPARDTIAWETNRIKNLHIVSNFVGGVSLNDCISNAEIAVQQSKFS